MLMLQALEQKLQPLEQKTTEVADKITSMVERNLTTLSPLKKIESTGSSTIKDNSSNTLPSTLPDNDDKKAALVANSKAQGPSAKAHHTAKSTGNTTAQVFIMLSCLALLLCLE